MKNKVILSLILVAGIFVNFLFAGTIGNLDLRFCDESKSDFNQYPTKINLEMDGGEQQEICFELKNNGNDDLSVRVNFVDGIFTNDEFQNKACKDEKHKELFGQYVEIDDSLVTVPAGETVRKTAKLKFPDSYGGNSYGCVTYYIDNQVKNENNDALKVLVRKARFVDVKVNGEINLGLEVVNYNDESNISSNPQLYIDDNKNKNIKIKLQNIGNITQNTQITGIITNIFGYEKKLEIGSRKILGKNEVEIETEIGKLPIYEGFYKIDVFVDHKAIFDFDAENITDEMRESKTIFISTNVFFYNLKMYAVVFGIIVLFIIIILFKRRKNNKKDDEKNNKKTTKKKTKTKKKSSKTKKEKK